MREEGRPEDEVPLNERPQTGGANSENVTLDTWESLPGDNVVHHEEVVRSGDVITRDQVNFNYVVNHWEANNPPAPPAAGRVQHREISPAAVAFAGVAPPTVVESCRSAPSNRKVKSGLSEAAVTQGDFSELDPISFVDREHSKDQRSKRTRQSTVNKNNQPLAPLPENPNRHLVPEDLQRLIITTNPGRSIKFTYSQRMNTQMVLNDFVLKKKKGPYRSRGGRIINWKCVREGSEKY